MSKIKGIRKDKTLEEKKPNRWLIPDRLLAAQARYNLNRLKREIRQYPGASELLEVRIEELVWLLDTASKEEFPS